MVGIRLDLRPGRVPRHRRPGAWSTDNLDTGGPGVWDWFGSGGLLASSFVLAFWTFVGIEFVCSLTEEVRHPRKAMPRASSSA